MVKISSPGKIILVGEHAAAYGYPVVASAIDKRIYVSAKKSNSIIFTSPQTSESNKYSLDEIKESYNKSKEMWERGFDENDFSELKDYLKSDVRNYMKNMIGGSLEDLRIDEGIDIVIKSEIKAKAGLGSSAALSVAVPKAIAEIYKKDISLEENNKIAYNLEKLNHGVVSGVDNTTCCYGGTILYSKIKSGYTKFDLSSFDNFGIVYTKERKKDVAELTNEVCRLAMLDKERVMQTIGVTALTFGNQLNDNQLHNVPALMNNAHECLKMIGVSIPEADEIHEAVKSIGGGAKISGGGGGGYMLCYHTNFEKLSDVISYNGYEIEKVELGCEGVRLENY